ncbi:MAG: polyprenyl diphosphate synthase [Patescibacteria group bacterium]
MLQSLPNHVGIILDGNRRWAKARNLPTLEGHRIGAENFKKIVHLAFDRGVACLSAFIFSTENWSRTDEEVGYLMNLVVKAFEEYLEEFHERGIKIVILGRRQGIRKKVSEVIKRTEEQTKNNSNGTLALCFNYGGEQELVDAVDLIRNKNDNKITIQDIRQNLYHPEVPNLDLMIRTSGEKRTSGFMLARAAYAELYFSDKLWPDFNEQDLDIALTDYRSRVRRFGE